MKLIRSEMEEDSVPDWMLSGVDHEVRADVESTTKKTKKEKTEGKAASKIPDERSDAYREPPPSTKDLRLAVMRSPISPENSI